MSRSSWNPSVYDDAYAPSDSSHTPHQSSTAGKYGDDLFDHTPSYNEEYLRDSAPGYTLPPAHHMYGNGSEHRLPPGRNSEAPPGHSESRQAVRRKKARWRSRPSHLTDRPHSPSSASDTDSFGRMKMHSSSTPPRSDSHNHDLPSLYASPTRVISTGPRRSYHEPEAFVPGTPSDEYFVQSLVPSHRGEKPSRKLLVLDLNGTLVFRAAPTSPGRPRVAHPRPYLCAFAEFIARHESIRTMVWSSAQPGNVANMVESAFGPLKEHLLHVWARDTLGLSAAEFGRKVQTVKNLDKLWAGLGPPPEGEEPFSSKDTVLLDDSALKAHMQPYNHLILPEYDLLMKRACLAAASEANRVEHDGLPPGIERTLLAVMGILDEMAMQDNVAGWMRAGGLWEGTKERSGEAAEQVSGAVEAKHAIAAGNASAEDVALDGDATLAEDLAATEDSTLVEGVPKMSRRQKRLRKKQLQQEKANADTSLDVQPAAATEPLSSQLWYEDPQCLEYWVERGIAALDRLGIPVEDGLPITGSSPRSSTSSLLSSDHDPREHKRSRVSGFDPVGDSSL